MTRRTIHLPVAAPDTIEDFVALAVRGEALGYDRVWMPETWGRDAVTTLAVIGQQTTTIGLGTSITPIYSRTPALVGQTAATLQESSGGRFRLGLGPSGPAVIENWHGVEFARPLRRTREYLEIIQQVLAGDVVSYDGEIFTLDGFRLRAPPPEPAPAIDVAGMSAKFVELAGRFADGWHAFMLTPAGLRERLADLERGATLGDRSAEEVRVTVSIPCCVLSDGDRARELALQHVAFYVGGMGTFYRDALAEQGHDETAQAVYSAWQAGERDEAMAALDPLLDKLAITGTPSQAQAAFERFATIDGVDAIAVSFPRGATLDEQQETLEALAP